VTEYANPDTEKNPNAKPNFRAAAKELAKLERQCGECNNYEKAQIRIGSLKRSFVTKATS